jgi:hypothetical protein
MKLARKKEFCYESEDDIERFIRLEMPEAIIIYLKDWRSEIRDLHIYLDITNELFRMVCEKDEKTGRYYVKVIDRLIEDLGL